VASADAGSVTFTDGWSLGFPEDFMPRPKPGDVVRRYGRGIGFSVRGLFLNGKKVRYQTAAEMEAEHKRENEERHAKKCREFEEQKAERDRRYEALPEIFRKRIDKFRRNNPNFRVEYEPYELFCCEEAVKIAAALKTPEEIDRFYKLPWEEQRALVPIDEGHSGNTFGCACMLAKLYLTRPEYVEQMHGALAPLVGSQEYGCVPSGEDHP
jgi:hypothetical protein